MRYRILVLAFVGILVLAFVGILTGTPPAPSVKGVDSEATILRAGDKVRFDFARRLYIVRHPDNSRTCYEPGWVERNCQ